MLAVYFGLEKPLVRATFPFYCPFGNLDLAASCVHGHGFYASARPTTGDVTLHDFSARLFWQVNAVQWGKVHLQVAKNVPNYQLQIVEHAKPFLYSILPAI